MKLKSPLKALATALTPLPNRPLRSFIAAALILHFALYTLHSPAAEPLCWERTPNRPAPAQFDTFHGQSLDFRCTFTGFGALPFDGASDVRLWYQTNGMGAAWWSIPATVSSNVLAATFTPDCDPGAERLTVFFGAPSNAYAAAQVRFRNSPGAHPNDLDPPSVLDWQAELAAATNDLFKSFAPTITNTYTKAETDARIAELAPRTSLEPATNYTDEVTGVLSNALLTGEMQVLNAWISQDAQHANHADVAGALSDGTSQRSGSQIFAQLDAASRITTNDVCNIVTNETEGAFGEWTSSDEDGYPAYVLVWTGNDEDDPEGFWFYDDFPFERNLGGNYYSTELTMEVDEEQIVKFTRIYTPGRNALGLARLSDLATATNDLNKSLAPTITNIASTVSSNAIASSDTTYRRTIGITNINQSVQYVNITDTAPTTLAISMPTDGVTKDWMVYVVSVTNVTLSLPSATWWMADTAYTNDVPPATPTAFWFSQVTDGIFILGRQELTEVTSP